MKHFELENFPILQDRFVGTQEPSIEKAFDISTDYVFVDLDGVIFDFDKGFTEKNMHPDDFKHTPGAYLYLDTVQGKKSIAAWKLLNQLFPNRVWFLSKPPKHSPYSYSEKALAVMNVFGEDGLHKLILSQDKSLLGTEKSIIIDDRPEKANLPNFRGDIIVFEHWQQTLADLEEIMFYRVYGVNK